MLVGINKLAQKYMKKTTALYIEPYTIYLDFIRDKRLLENSNTEDVYHMHHIIPRCLGGNNSKDNLIYL